MSAKEILFSLMIAIILAFVISPFASPWPDGLEKVAEDKGFIEKGEVPPALTSPVPDYAWPGIKNEGLSTGLAGVFGTLIVFCIGYGTAALARRR